MTYYANASNVANSKYATLKVLMYDPHGRFPDKRISRKIQGVECEIYVKRSMDNMMELRNKEKFNGTIYVKRERAREISLLNFPEPIHVLLETNEKLSAVVKVESSIVGLNSENMELLLTRILAKRNSLISQYVKKPDSERKYNLQPGKKNKPDWRTLKSRLVPEIQADKENMNFTDAVEAFVMRHGLSYSETETVRRKYLELVRKNSIKWTPELKAELKDHIEEYLGVGETQTKTAELFCEKKGWPVDKSGAVMGAMHSLMEAERQSGLKRR